MTSESRIDVKYGPEFSLNPVKQLLAIKDGEVVFDVPDHAPERIREQINNLTKILFKTADQPDFPVTHTFINGVYTRSLFIPKGSILVGKIHLKECVNIVAKGDISILTERGVGRFQAGFVTISGPGIQKVGYAHEDTVFINVFRTDETNISKIEAEIASENFSAIEQIGNES